MLEVKLLLLIGIANGTPVIVKRLLGEHWAFPLDAHKKFIDGRPLLGPSKTVRGVFFSLIITAVCASILDMHWLDGIVIAATAMLGDLSSSFTKRRLGKPSSSMALVLDQVPESLFPMLAAKYWFELSWLSVVVVVVVFFILELVLSRILYKLKIRKEPY